MTQPKLTRGKSKAREALSLIDLGDEKAGES